MTVIIGFGNPLRGDDGVGPEVARQIEAVRGDVEVLTPQQLLPELAATLAAATAIVFVDAATGGTPGTISCHSVRPAHAGAIGHVLSPAALVTLTTEVFGWEPHAWLVQVHGSRFDLGTSLSPEVQRAVPAAVDAVLALVAAPATTRP